MVDGAAEGQAVRMTSPTPQDTVQQTTPPRRLRRSSTDRLISGVSGGLGEHLGVDPVVIRVGFVFATLLTGGAALLAYLALLAVVPGEDGGAHHPATA
jgi:phage shock protein PspC (stress-responsive transcriptional regulator)